MNTQVKYIFVLLLTFLIFPNFVMAECTYENQAKYKSIADNINYNIDYTESEKNVVFSVRFSNVLSSLYIYDSVNEKSYTPNTANEITISNLQANQKYTFEIKTSTTLKNDQQVIYVMQDGKWVPGRVLADVGADCSNRNVRNLYITLPPYNYRYKDSLCDGLGEETICQKWTSNNLSDQQFADEIKKIKDTKQQQPTDNNQTDNESGWLTLLRKYYWAVGIVILAVGTLIYTIYRKRKNDGFEGW